MDVLVISGSPNKSGNCEQMAADVRSIVEERGYSTALFSLAHKKVEPCTACNACAKEPRCPIEDDMEEAYGLLRSAKGVFVIAPVYFGCVSAQLKALFDRTLLLRRDGMALKGKVGAAASVGRARNGGQELTIQAVHAWMHISGMVVVGDDSHFGGTVVHPYAEDEFGRQTVRNTASKLCDVLDMLR
ncbi:flavodoxin family protein [Methermicoccus shengliensis]|uniref:Flavodoxin family protein n=1 Tax=Methermicoccus shengliensis TaxID=660064 RepID=A0A832VZ75_9EURY|nr:flavodoxin family protein [Methermicoccus shengliensis]KUK05155.1 MAG: Iron-sulfur flavoprotein [Euryarchaeota archaeon 55_53]KUK30721.1 MAG: Iron-sulfur flavoprotein [Methanosarcinales archeaon 56_1174]MDI3487315.1 hypothetical protein [Methanosarcinales archaeon]MDN5294611.1 hypothetical protein [Methanosarcinales archaeon]HIH69319.1 flavodoxin family protein [Methermicoccus shengliensis]